MRTVVTITIDTAAADGRKLLAPLAVPTTHQIPLQVEVEGANMATIYDSCYGQAAALIAPEGSSAVALRYLYEDKAGSYPAEMFIHRSNRFTEAAEDLVRNARSISAAAGGGAAGIAAIVNEAAERFTYGHPIDRFYDGHDQIPSLGCGVAEGSCVDINTYVIASLRAAGFEAGYLYGYFFPKEKMGNANDGHCWVVTRHEGQTLEWDIAHHLKLGTRRIQSGLNPRPGHRVACSHSMGLSFPQLGIENLKVLGEAGWVDGKGGFEWATIRIFAERSE